VGASRSRLCSARVSPETRLTPIDPPETQTDPYAAAAKGSPDAFRPETPDEPRPFKAADFDKVPAEVKDPDGYEIEIWFE